ncbi:MAG: iron-siderophore ABC transporter substrate-binding protein [Cyanobacteria bacterium J06649_4]
MASSLRKLTIQSAVLFILACAAAVLFSACHSPLPINYEPISPSAGRVVNHANGESVIPLDPQRVVIMGSVIDAVALGVEPVGATLTGIPQRANVNQLSPMMHDKTDDIAVLGHSNQPNLESMVALAPDLILATQKAGNLYRRLAQIAPTVVIDTSKGASEWKTYVLNFAIALGKESEAQALVQQYEQRVTQFRQLMGDRLETTLVSVGRFRPDHVRIYQQNSFSGAVLADIGLLRPERQQKNKPFEKISIEDLSSLDGDVLFFMQDNPDNSMLGQVQGHPLWSQLDVVKQQAVYEVSLEVWFLNSGIVSAHMMLNDLFRMLVPNGEQYVITQVGELSLPSELPSELPSAAL